jgi:hypothetical protein
VNTRPPQRLVRVDVPDPRECALVEESRLDRRLPRPQLLREAPRGERLAERLGAESVREIRLEFSRLDEQPGAEAPHVAIGNVRSVV